jgi:uncharacterized membrane protein
MIHLLLMKLFSRILPETLILAAILAVATVMRFWGYSGFSFSNDELSALFRLRFDNFSDLVDKGFYVDGHPGGVQVFLWYWIKLFGTSEASLRFPFVIAGVLSVLFSYLIAKRWFGRASGLLVASAMAFLMFPLLYSQIARPYGSGIFLVLFMVYLWTHLVFDSELKQRKKIHYAAAYAIATAACMYNHYFSFLMAIVVGLTGLFFIRRKDLVFYLVSGLAALVLFLPHVYITLNHLSIGGVGEWLAKPGPWWLFNHIFFIFNNSWLVLVSVLIVALTFPVINREKLIVNKFVIISLCWFLVPFLVAYVYSREVNPVLQDAVLLFSFPFLLFALFAAAGDNVRKPFPLILVSFFVIGIFSTSVEKNYYRAQHFGEFKDVAKTLASWQSKYGDDSLTVAISANNPYYLNYYLKKENSQIAFILTDCVGRQGLIDLGKVLQTCRTPYFAYAWTKPVSPVTADLISAIYPYVIGQKNYEGFSEVTLYSKSKPLNPLPSELPYRIHREDYSISEMQSESQSHADSGIYHSPPSSLRLDSLIEFGPGYVHSLEALGNPSLVRAGIWSNESLGLNGAQLVISLETKDGESLQWGSSEFDLFANPSSWFKVIHSMRVPKNSEKDAVLKIYVWNPGKKRINIDDFEVELYHE